MLEEPTFSRRSWIDTINEVKVQYSEIVGERGWSLYPEDLVAWYKIDEGEGLIVHNSANPTNSPKWGDMTIEGQATPPGTFWTHFPGFGSNDLLGGVNGQGHCKWVSEESTCQNGNYEASFGCFCRSEGYFGSAYERPALFAAESSVDWAVESRRMEINITVSNFLVGGYHSGSAIGNITQYQWSAAERKNKWQFIFVLGTGGTGTTLNVIKEDGTRLIGNITGNLEAGSTIKQLKAFIRYDDANDNHPSFWGQISDIIIYVDRILTLEDWAAWYDQLRERYGMAARSGW